MASATKPTNQAKQLNANPDPHHWSYKILGLISWLAFLFCIVGMITGPRTVLDVARVFAFYTLFRFIMVAVFYLVGLVRIRLAVRRIGLWVKTHQDPTNLPGPVHHLVVIPNYREPVEVVTATIRTILAQPVECSRMTLVLAMEEREKEARSKVQQIVAMFKGQFTDIQATYHPDGLPGEIIGKGVNETWAVRQMQRELVEHRRIPADQIIVTISDSDSHFHPLYFSELARLFVEQQDRHQAVWHSPILLSNDIWRANFSVRMLAFLTNAVQLSELANPAALASPISSYSLSLRQLESVNYWDPATIAEDTNLFLRCLFASNGHVRLQPVFLPVHANPVFGVSLWQSWVISYRQKIRHAWGATDIGYILQKWALFPRTPFYIKFVRFFKVLHDHLVLSTTGIIVLLGTIISIMLDSNPVITILPEVDPLFLAIFNGLSGVAMIVFWLGERFRLGRERKAWSLSLIVGEIATLILLAGISLALVSLPALHAQTMMLFGETIVFYRTPKSVKSRTKE